MRAVGTETHGPELSSSVSCVLIRRAEVTSQENIRGAKKPCVLPGVVSDQVLTTDLSHLGWSLHAVFTKLLLGTLGGSLYSSVSISPSPEDL